MLRRPPRSTRTDTLFPYTTLFRSIGLLRGASKAGGFHLSLAQRGRPELYSVEFNAMGVAAQAMQQAGLHANHVIHPEMTGFPQVITDSSLHRQQRGDALLNGLRTHPLTILADQRSEEHTSELQSPMHNSSYSL